jgi:hypothetical protein
VYLKSNVLHESCYHHHQKFNQGEELMTKLFNMIQKKEKHIDIAKPREIILSMGGIQIVVSDYMGAF